MVKIQPAELATVHMYRILARNDTTQMNRMRSLYISIQTSYVPNFFSRPQPFWYSSRTSSAMSCRAFEIICQFRTELHSVTNHVKRIQYLLNFTPLQCEFPCYPNSKSTWTIRTMAAQPDKTLPLCTSHVGQGARRRRLHAGMLDRREKLPRRPPPWLGYGLGSPMALCHTGSPGGAMVSCDIEPETHSKQQYSAC